MLSARLRARLVCGVHNSSKPKNGKNPRELTAFAARSRCGCAQVRAYAIGRIPLSADMSWRGPYAKMVHAWGTAARLRRAATAHAAVTSCAQSPPGTCAVTFNAQRPGKGAPLTKTLIRRVAAAGAGAHSAGRPPKRRCRAAYSRSAAASSGAPKSGQQAGANTSSACAASQAKKSLRRCSPDVRTSRSTSRAPGGRPADQSWPASASRVACAHCLQLGRPPVLDLLASGALLVPVLGSCLLPAPRCGLWAL